MHKSTHPSHQVPIRKRPLGAKKRVNRKRRNWGPILYGIGTVMIAIELGVALFANPYLEVTHVRVLGTQTLTNSDVLEDARIPAHKNIFLMVLREQIARRLTKDPVIDHAFVSISLPRTIVLHVTERQPFAVLSIADQDWLLDSKGVPYRELTELPAGIPVLKLDAAAPPVAMTLGKPLQTVWLKEAYKLMALLSDKKNLNVATIKVDQNANLCLNRVDNLQIKLGQPDSLPLKVALAQATVSADGGSIAKRAAYIDVSCPEQPVWMPRPASQDGRSKHGIVSRVDSERNASNQ